MGLTDIEWEDGFDDPLENLSPGLRRKVLQQQSQVTTKWSKSKRVTWLIGLIASLIWAAVWCLLGLVLTICTLGLGLPVALLAWSVGTGPACSLIVARLRATNTDTIPTY